MSKLQVQFIIEILGRPPEHLVEALQTVVLRLNAESGVKVLEKSFNEPKPVEDSNDLHTTFVDLILEIDNIGIFFQTLFTYMPAHVELISPEKMEFSNADINDLSNKTLGRLHEYDALAKKFMNDRKELIKQLYEHAPQVFKEDVRAKIENELKNENIKPEQTTKKKKSSDKKQTTKKSTTKKKK